MDNYENEKLYEIIPQHAEEPEKKRKIFTKSFMKSAVAFALGMGITLGAVNIVVPSAVEKQLASKISYSQRTQTTKDNKNTKATTTASKDGALSVVEIAKKVGPTVVGINTKVRSTSIFGTMQESEGSGSGIILTSDGYIVTNNHVISGANSVTVVLNDGQTYDAKVTGADETTDLAVLKIDGKNLPYATLGNSSELEVGELAVAIGNPLGNELAGTVTVGYISALNRSITVDDRQFNLIQTDAAINSGNSGGALINCYGEVIGINSAKMSASGVEGIGFAIPIDGAKPIIEDLKTSGYVTGRPVIGISGRSVSERDSQYYNIPVGVYVYEVVSYSGAEKAGLRAGDVIVEFNGVTIKTIDELNKQKEKLKVGSTVSVTYKRDGKSYSTKITLQEEKPTTELN